MQGDGTLILSGLALARQKPPRTEHLYSRAAWKVQTAMQCATLAVFDAGLAARQRASSILAGRMHVQPRVGTEDIVVPV
jgi:hypothetical protein